MFYRAIYTKLALGDVPFTFFAHDAPRPSLMHADDKQNMN